MLPGSAFYSAIIWKGEGAYLQEMPKTFKAYLNWNFVICSTHPLWLWSRIGSRVKIRHYIRPSNLSSVLQNLYLGIFLFTVSPQWPTWVPTARILQWNAYSCHCIELIRKPNGQNLYTFFNEVYILWHIFFCKNINFITLFGLPSQYWWG